jgi:MscS family membrane protein
MLYCFVRTPDWSTELRERHRLLLDIMRLAKQLQVEFAFPTRTLYLRQDTVPTSGDFPGTREEALSRGRELADEITIAGLGPDRRAPPPVEM